MAVFQPHRYSRLSLLMKEFATSFNQADILVTTEVYPAGEAPLPGVSGEALFGEIQQFGHKNVHFEPDLNGVVARVSELAQPGDIIIVMGAGSITRIIPEIILDLEAG
jgi:UDP-N-acetylmuramate--alanine ligase